MITQNPTTKPTAVIVSVEEFWNRKVEKLKILYTYGAISEDKFINDMVNLGFTKKQIIDLYGDDDDDER
tara:strand:+ start:2124 stop:2330 length:207 start_codon:yes stop_codon:yes gene_type:complete